MHSPISSLSLYFLATTLAPSLLVVDGFVPAPPLATRTLHRSGVFTLSAGGFEWEDPGEAFDQGVENPYKNPDLTKGEEGLKIDPARLLSPRLNGANLYLVGMMGSGKSSVGKVVANRKCEVGSLD